MPFADLSMNFSGADGVSPEHESSAMARKAEAVEPHHVDVAGTVGLAVLEDLARLVHRSEQKPPQDVFIGEGPLRYTEVLRNAGDHLLDDVVGIRGAVAFLVAI